jgi:hypothetical protein
MTRRLNAAERAGFRRYARELAVEPRDVENVQRGKRGPFADITPAEPALGTLDERLAVIIRRLGGRLKVGKPTADELASVVRYDVLPGPRGGFRSYVEQELTAA